MIAVLAGTLSRLICMLPLSPPIDLDRAEAQARANEELSKAKYGVLPKWMEEATKRIESILNDMLTVLTGNTSSGGVSWGIIIVVIVVLALVAFIVWRVGLPRWRRVKAADAIVEVDQSVAPSVYRDAAEAAAARGDYRTAIRERFRAIIRELEFRTIITPRASRTAFEAAAVTARELPQAQEAMYSAAAVFSEVMYGDTPGTALGWETMVAADAAVHAAADHPVGAAHE